MTRHPEALVQGASQLLGRPLTENELDSLNKPTIVVLNKIDKLEYKDEVVKNLTKRPS